MKKKTLQLLKEDPARYIFAFMTRDCTPNQVFFLDFALRRILKRAKVQKTYAPDELLLLLDSFPLPISDDEKLRILEKSMLFELSSSDYRLKEEVSLAIFFESSSRMQKKRIQTEKLTPESIYSLLYEKENFFPTGIQAIRQAILHGMSWIEWTVSYAMNPDNGLKNGLPPFWRCYGKEGDEAFGFLRAATANGDSLGILLESFYNSVQYSKIETSNQVQKIDVINALIKYNLDGQCMLHQAQKFNNPEWILGGFFPFDDQPNAYYPTVDSTWDNLIALSSLYDLWDEVSELGLLDYQNATLHREDIGNRIELAVKYLLRMQLPSGGWGIYRYPEDSSPVREYEFSNSMVITALGLLMNTSFFNQRQALKQEVLKSVESSWLFLLNTRQEKEGNTVWTSFFSVPVDSCNIDDLLKTTSWVISSILFVFDMFPNHQEVIIDILEEYIHFVTRFWKPNHDKIAMVEFRVPLKHQIQDTYSRWKNRIDTTVAPAILSTFLKLKKLEAYDTAALFSDSLWFRVEEVIYNLLAEQDKHHGHWHEPVEGNPLTAATMYAIQILNLYLDSTSLLL